MILGVLGKAGSGKDTFADMLVNNHNFCKIAFADPIKRFCMDTFDFTEEQLWGPSEKRSEPDDRYLRYLTDARHTLNEEGLKKFPSGMVPEYLTPRYALQQIGTEGARSCYEDVWVDYAIRKVNLLMSSNIYRYSRTVGVYSVTGDVELDGSKHPSGVVISDCRFINEIQKLRKSGGVMVKIVREGAGLEGAAAQHQSETEQDYIPDSEFDHIIYNNSTLEDLEIKVENFTQSILGSLQ